MELKLETNDLNEYLTASTVIDYENENIQAIAARLAKNATSDVELARAAYEFVRDGISHSFDIDCNAVTCEASNVLKHREGICYAKSHLLAAILRHLKIPAGFCYQKLVLDDSEKPWMTLHGLNAIYLESLDRWIRVDARGNKEGVNAQFNLDREILAFAVREELGEIDDPTIYAKPSKNVIEALRKSKTFEELVSNLPGEL